MKLKQNLQALLALGFGLIVSLFLIEASSRIFDLDIAATWLSRSVVGFEWLQKDVHRPSENPQLLYELSPNISAINSYTHPKELKYKKARMTINSMGFRGAEFNIIKMPGVFRIFIVGSSNTFGALVSDEDTYPVQTAQLLEKKYPGQFEIINAGVSGYVLSQESNRAQEIVNKYSPDLIIIQRNNIGRRAFYFKDENYVSHFKLNSELFRENLPNLFTESEKILKFHYLLIDFSAAYRLITGILNYFKYRLECEGESLAKCLQNNPVRFFYQKYGDYISQRESIRLFTENKKINFVIFHSSGSNPCRNETDKEYPNLSYYNICEKLPGEEYAQIHPPSYVYTWYAKQLAEFIIEKRNSLTDK